MMLWLALLLGGFDPQYAEYGEFLNDHVVVDESGTRSTVDYQAALDDRPRLGRVLDRMESVTRDTYDQWRPDQQLAFLINLYNAATLALILDHYPDLDSIRDLGSLFTSPWERPVVKLFGEPVTLDHIEHDLIRGGFAEPRIHAAVNCASCGCPALRNEPFVADRLDEQLAAAMNAFLRDRQRNRVEPASERVVVSKIFDWYGEDFERSAGSLRDWLADQTGALADTPEAEVLLRAGNFRVRHSRYDWTLNDVGRCPAP